jgi:hypothetical protein
MQLLLQASIRCYVQAFNLVGGQYVEAARPKRQAALRALSILQSRLGEITLVVRETS